jgi:hypothetical protein
MRFWRRQRRSEPTDLGEATGERRLGVTRCAGCGRALPPYVYLSNGKDYCVPCAREIGSFSLIAPSGERRNDVTEVD